MTLVVYIDYIPALSVNLKKRIESYGLLGGLQFHHWGGISRRGLKGNSKAAHR